MKGHGLQARASVGADAAEYKRSHGGSKVGFQMSNSMKKAHTAYLKNNQTGIVVYVADNKDKNNYRKIYGQ